MAWAKLLFLRDYGDTEVGAFGICPTHPLLVEDVQLVQQQCTWATVAFDDESVADMFEDRVTGGLRPDQFARIWIHTHPGFCANPSFTDENTFERVFGSVDWAVMFILACGGECYARMRSAGELDADSQEAMLEVEVDYSAPFSATDFEAWEAEYLANVTCEPEFDCFITDSNLEDELDAAFHKAASSWDGLGEEEDVLDDDLLLRQHYLEERYFYEHDYSTHNTHD